MSQEDYDSLIESYSSYYDVEEVNDYKYKADRFADDSSGSLYELYFIYNEGLVTQVLFIDVDETDKATVLNNIELPKALETESGE